MPMYHYSVRFVVSARNMDAAKYKLARAIRPRKHIILMPSDEGEDFTLEGRDMDSIDNHRARAQARKEGQNE